MAQQKRNRLMMAAVVFGYLIAYRIVLWIVTVAALTVYMLHIGVHDRVAIKQHIRADFGASLSLSLLALVWGGRIGIVTMARKGMLPGTRFPGQAAEYAAVFASDVPRPAQRLPEPRTQPAPVIDQPGPARKVFGTRGTTAPQV